MAKLIKFATRGELERWVSDQSDSIRVLSTSERPSSLVSALSFCVVYEDAPMLSDGAPRPSTKH